MDQMLGQWWGHQLGMDWIYDKAKVNSAMAAVFKINFRSNFKGITQKPREFTKENEAGMQMIVWPEGNRPKRHTSYADEVMSGFEYSTAALMIKSGLLIEGLMVLKAVDDRYDGRKRTGYKGDWGNWGFSGNPYGDDECGKFYSRSLSIWSTLLMMQGFEYNGPQGVIGFDPAWKPENHISFFTAASGWGLFHQIRSKTQQTNRIELKYGTLRLKKIHLTLPSKAKLGNMFIRKNGKLIDLKHSMESKILKIQFQQDILINENEEIRIIIEFKE